MSKGTFSLIEYIKKNYIYVSVVGLLTIFMTCVWIFAGIGPGGKSLIIVDGLHQYIPFFSDYYEKLTHGGSMFYSFHGGMGYNFYSLWAYYLSSPLNLLILLFPKEELNTAVSLIVSLKIVMSGWTFAYAALHRSKVKYQHPGVIPLALGYAVSNYVIGYYWNVMWMDCILILPLIMLGYDYMVEKRDPRLYILSLFYALIGNYYIAFMICIFLIVWAIFYSYDRLRDMGRMAYMFPITSIISAAMAAVVLVPAYLGINETASAKRIWPGWDTYGSYWNIASGHMIGAEPINNQINDGGVNLYCGIFAVFFMVLYLVSKEFKLRDKIKYVLILSLFIISYNTEILNYIWHGLHDQFGIPNRFSFIYIFVLLWMAYEVLLRYRRISAFAHCLAGMITLLFITLCYTESTAEVKPVGYLISGLVVLIYVILSVVYKCKEDKGKLWRMILSMAMTVEILAVAGYNWSTNGVVTVDYYFGETEVIQDIRQDVYAEDSGFYRMELANTKMLDEPTWHNLRCVTLFGSTAQGSMVSAMGRIGFYIGANEYLYCGATPFTSALTSMKYVIFRPNDFNNHNLNYVATYGDGVYLCENPYWLPVGFMVNREAVEFDSYATYFDVQNGLVEAMTGAPDYMFSEAPLTWQAQGTGAVTTVNMNTISYEKIPEEGDNPVVRVSTYIPENMDLYFDVSGGNVRQIKLFVDGQQVADDRYQGQAFHIGAFTQGQQVEMEFVFNQGGSDTGTVTIHSFKWDMEMWEKQYARLQENPLYVEKFSDGYFRGNVTAKDNQVLFMSIPYDVGWHIQVDGEEIVPNKVLDAFIAIPVTAGEHTIEMRYITPGFILGCVLSVLGVLGLILVWILTKRGQRNRAMSAEAEHENEAGSRQADEETEHENEAEGWKRDKDIMENGIEQGEDNEEN